MPKDMPKLESPFVRQMSADGEAYLVTPEVAESMSWVFDDPTVLATEKLDGTNVSIVIENKQIVSIWNRTEQIPFFSKGKSHIVEGVIEAFKRGFCELPDGQHFGELIGEKVNGNPLKIQGHLWVPFNTYCREHLAYKSWGKYSKDFETISKWFKDDLFSLWVRKKGVVQPAEGVVFVQPSTGKMAKLRRDMYAWFEGRKHKGS